jgi:hypothetical protein
MLVGIGVVGHFTLPKAGKAEAEKAQSVKDGLDRHSGRKSA